jgi:hypothetical protein
MQGQSDTARSAANRERTATVGWDNMDVVGSFGTLRRQWILALLLLVLTLAGTVYEAHKPGPYQSTSQVVLLPSAKISKTNGNNPYLSFVTSISLTADLVRRELMDPRTSSALAAQGFPSSYQVVDDPATAGPVLDVTATGSSKASVEHTLYGVTAEIATKLGEMQAGVQEPSRITSQVVSFSTQPSLMKSKKARTVVVVLGIGLVLTFAISQIADATLGRRRRKSRPRAYGGGSPAGQQEEDSVVHGSYERNAAESHPRVGAALRGRED